MGPLTHFGAIEVVCGGMFSGKTEELMRRMKRAQFARQKIKVFKPKIDNRYSEDHVQSHDSNRIPSIPISKAAEILDHLEDTTRVVGIDEAQFFDSEIIDVAQRLANRGVRVVLAGLDMDFRGDPFGPMPILLAVAEHVTKLSAVCMVCGAPATRSQLLPGNKMNQLMLDGALTQDDSSENPVLVGAADRYEARCRYCHDISLADNS